MSLTTGIQPDDCEATDPETGATCHLLYGHDGDHEGQQTVTWKATR